MAGSDDEARPNGALADNLPVESSVSCTERRVYLVIEEHDRSVRNRGITRVFSF